MTRFPVCNRRLWRPVLVARPPELVSSSMRYKLLHIPSTLASSSLGRFCAPPDSNTARLWFPAPVTPTQPEGPVEIVGSSTRLEGFPLVRLVSSSVYLQAPVHALLSTLGMLPLYTPAARRSCQKNPCLSHPAFCCFLLCDQAHQIRHGPRLRCVPWAMWACLCGLVCSSLGSTTTLWLYQAVPCFSDPSPARTCPEDLVAIVGSGTWHHYDRIHRRVPGSGAVRLPWCPLGILCSSRLEHGQLQRLSPVRPSDGPAAIV